MLVGAIVLGGVSGLSLTLLIRMIHQSLLVEAPDPVRFLGYYMLVWMLFVCCTTAATLMTSGMAHKALYALRELVTDRILNVSYRTVESRGATFFPVLTEDVQTIANTLYRIPAITTATATIIGCFVYMLILSWTITLGIVILFVVIYLMMTAIGKRAQSYGIKARNEYDRIYRFFEDLVYGLKELKLNPWLRQHYRHHVFPPMINSHQKLKFRENVLFNFSIRTVEILFFPALGVLVYSIIVYNISTPGAFSGVLTVLLFMLSPLATMANFVSEYKAMQVSMVRLDELDLAFRRSEESGESLSNLSHQITKSKALTDEIDNHGIRPEDTDTKNELASIDASVADGVRPEDNDTSKDGALSDASSIQRIHQKDNDEPLIRFTDVEVSYSRDDGVTNFKLGPVSVDLPVNKIIFVTGDNGSGKSTFAKVLTGLYAPERGEVVYRGQTVTHSNRESYRSRFSSVFSDFHLFTELPPETVGGDVLQSWIDRFGISKHVHISQNKITTSKLSQGQRERLAFAFACSYPSEIVVLDEVSSNQDSGFRNKIYHEIIPELKDLGKTVVVISHDERYFELADVLLHFKNGQLVLDQP